MTNAYTRIKKKQDSLKRQKDANIIRVDERTIKLVKKLLNS